jgi:hypothetical protein
MTNFRFLIYSTVSALAILLLFLPGLEGGFIFDDIPNIVENTALHLSAMNFQEIPYAAYSFQPGKGSRSLAMVSFAMDYWRGGLDPTVFKTTNLIIHALTAVALAFFFRLLLRLTDWPERRIAATALVLAGLWAIHPLQVSSVLYVVQRMQTMVTLFMVLAMWSYLKMRKAQIDGERSRQFGMMVLLFWVLGLASKEDAALLPLYTLGIELMIFKFRAADRALAMLWKKLYYSFMIIGPLIFFIFILPRYWSWGAYPGRSFSSTERLLTQGWVLLMYIRQIFVPMPGDMPFYYDYLDISRNLWSPWYTLPSWLLIIGMLFFSWKVRDNQPRMALGIWIFFSGHFLTSNVINLEIAFEHRNHFPLIGAVLVFFEICRYFTCKYKLRPQLPVIGIMATAMILGAGTSVRAHEWGEPLRFAEWGVKTAPHSARAWLELCTAYFRLSNQEKNNPLLDRAINVCQQGGGLTQAPALLSNVIIFKTIKGNVTQEDWGKFLASLEHVSMTRQNKEILWIMMRNIDRRIPLDEAWMLRTIDFYASRINFEPDEYLRLGAYVFNETNEPQKAYYFFQKAAEYSPSDDSVIEKIIQDLIEVGKQDWADRLTDIRNKKLSS